MKKDKKKKKKTITISSSSESEESEAEIVAKPVCTLKAHPLTICFLNECVKHYLFRENKAIHCSVVYFPSLISCFTSILHFFFLFFLEQETKAECGDKKLSASRGERRQNGEFVQKVQVFSRKSTELMIKMVRRTLVVRCRIFAFL